MQCQRRKGWILFMPSVDKIILPKEFKPQYFKKTYEYTILFYAQTFQNTTIHVVNFSSSATKMRWFQIPGGLFFFDNHLLGQIKWKKHKKSWPFPKLIFCHQWSLLDWTRMIQALFCVPGPHRGRGGPILGFGGPEGSKIWNFQTGPLLTVRCNFFDLNSL